MSKTPFVTKEMIEEIVKTYPTPFHIYDEKGIRENAKNLKEAFCYKILIMLVFLIIFITIY